MKDMADAMGVSVAFLSAVETSAKGMPMDKLEKVIERYEVPVKEAVRMRKLASQAKQTINIKVQSPSRELLTAFARRVHDLDSNERQAIMKILDAKVL